MKHFLFVCGTILLLLHATLATGQDATRILHRTARALSELKTIRYHQYREVADAAMDYFASNAGDCYFEFGPASADRQLTRFQLRSKDMMQVYNGTESFLLHEATRTYEVERPESLEGFRNLSLLYHSIPTLRKALPRIAKEEGIQKEVRDTLIAGKPYHLVSFRLQNKQLDFLNGFSGFSTDITTFYKLVIDRKTYLPAMVLYCHSKSAAYSTKTVFSDIETKPAAPAASTWFYSSYKDYKLKAQVEPRPLVALGDSLPAWALPQYTGKEPLQVSSADLKGKVVLLEFWIRNCGYCVASFPHLKALQEKYSPESLQVVAINTYDKLEDVAFFHDREKPNYKMLYKGEALAQEIGAVYYPTVIVLDRTGKVVYAGSFDKKKVEQAVEQVL